MPFKLLIFDLDGTLAETRQDLNNATNHVRYTSLFKTNRIRSLVISTAQGHGLWKVYWSVILL